MLQPKLSHAAEKVYAAYMVGLAARASFPVLRAVHLGSVLHHQLAIPVLGAPLGHDGCGCGCGR